MREITTKSGTLIPPIGFGTFGSDHYGPARVGEAVSMALEAGYRLFDCAEIYGNEDYVGGALRRSFDAGQARRNELFVVSKVWNNHHGAGEPEKALLRSLRGMGLDFVDAYFVHWPFPNDHAPGCDGDSRNPDSKPFCADEFMSVWREMESLCDAGLTRYLGMSNMTVKKLRQTLPRCRILPALIEMELHPSFQQEALFEYCAASGIRILGFCPLGSPNRPERDRTEGDVSDIALPEVLEVARAHGISPAQVCLKWAAQKGAIPIPFSGSEANIRANLRCLSEDALTENEMRLLRGAERDCRLVKGQVFLWPSATDWRQLWD